LQIDCSRNKVVFITQTADSKQPSMAVFGAESYIFWQPMATRLSISLWQFYGTQMVAILRYIPYSPWQFFCTDYICKFTAFQSHFYDLKVYQKCVKKKRKKEIKLTIWC